MAHRYGPNYSDGVLHDPENGYKVAPPSSRWKGIMSAVVARLGLFGQRHRKTNEQESPQLRDLTPDQIQALIDSTARELLRVDGVEALRMLDAGELDGTVAGESLRSLRWLLAA
jgi:hypothetical protein